MQCHWDVALCRSDLYVQPMWNHLLEQVEGVEYKDHLLHLEKCTVSCLFAPCAPRSFPPFHA
eukprot:SAG25_NODE_915_length_4775_cov_71.349872_2_plen_62_part_00